MKSILQQIVLTLTACLLLAQQAGASTLEEVKQRGVLRCGVSPGLPGLSQQDDQGRWRGLDVDLCRAVAAATLDDAEKVAFVPLITTERLTAVQKGRIDLLVRNTTWTMERDISLGLDFVGVNYYDGQGFLVPKKKGLRSALQLDGASICVQEGSTSIDNVQRYFTVNRMRFSLVTFDTPEAIRQAFEQGKCDVLTSDQSQLYGLRSQLAEPKQFAILPEIISREPLGPVVREGDDNWADIVRWSLFTMINAEERGISSRNVKRAKNEAESPVIRRLLGLDGFSGQALGLDSLWSYRIIEQVGNYGESFDRNLGKQSKLKIGRGLNALWTHGGLMYAPPSR